MDPTTQPRGQEADATDHATQRMGHLETMTWILGPLQGMSCRVGRHTKWDVKPRDTLHFVGRDALWDVTPLQVNFFR